MSIEQVRGRVSGGQAGSRGFKVSRVDLSKEVSVMQEGFGGEGMGARCPRTELTEEDTGRR